MLQKSSALSSFTRSRNFAFFIVVIGNFIDALDSSIVTIALPVMSKYFKVGLVKIQWITIVYYIGILSILPISSKFGYQLRSG